jgi:UDP-galactopyranose mutase
MLATRSTSYDYLIVGCGLSGSVLAERIATVLGKTVLIVDRRDHIGGNCFDYTDGDTNIRLNKYGAHLFHTNDETVWNYINKYGEWVRWDHKVVSLVNGRYVSLPVNITTVNELCNIHLETEADMNQWLHNHQIKYDSITNSEEMAKSRIGNTLYTLLIHDYTYKQWDKYPNELDKSVLARIPIRTNQDTRYFSDKFQALPKHGYTEFFENLLNHPNITVQLNTDYNQIEDSVRATATIYTGPIDVYFSNSNLPRLEYRSIIFHNKTYYNTKFFQPNSVVNFPSKDTPFTRSIEYKHFLNQQSPHTVVISETTSSGGDPYYPVPDERNQELYKKYQHLAHTEEAGRRVLFVGRLANYKYFNMDEAIKNSLDTFNSNPFFTRS